MTTQTAPTDKVRIRMGAMSFALQGLTAMRACGIFFNPYENMGGFINPSLRRVLDLFVEACIELGFIPNLRRTWDHQGIQHALEMWHLPEDQREEFIRAFCDALQLALGPDEFLGNPDLPKARTAEDERRDVVAYVAGEASKFERATACEETWTNSMGSTRERLEAKGSILRTLQGYFARGDHEGAEDR